MESKIEIRTKDQGLRIRIRISSFINPFGCMHMHTYSEHCTPLGSAPWTKDNNQVLIKSPGCTLINSPGCTPLGWRPNRSTRAGRTLLGTRKIPGGQRIIRIITPRQFSRAMKISWKVTDLGTTNGVSGHSFDAFEGILGVFKSVSNPHHVSGAQCSGFERILSLLGCYQKKC